MKKIFFKKIARAHSGYTIVETMIAVSLFLIVITISMGSLLNANAVHEKSRKMRSIMDSLSFAMEDISRNLRTGYNYHCILVGESIPTGVVSPRSCDTGGGGISFKSDLGDQWVYYIGTNSNGGTYSIFKSVTGITVQLTPDEIDIDPISSFLVVGAEPPESPLSPTEQQPFVTIKLVGKIILKDNTETPFSLQTSASQRLIDI